MRKFFFNVYFEYETGISADDSKTISSFNIGYFSSRKIANGIIKNYITKPGFKDYPIDYFKIQKAGVNFDKEIDKTKTVLYELSHEYENKNHEYEFTIFGVYCSKEKAKQECLFQSKKRKYKNSPEGFSISKWHVDKSLEWQDGFVSVK